MKKIAALTMVRNDDFFLQKWVEYYGAQLGPENLYVYFDGTAQPIPGFCKDVHAQCVPKIGSSVVSAEKGRLGFLSDRAADLFARGYDLVIGCDADEYLVVDPARGKSLREFLSEQRVDGSLSGLGLDFGQRLGEEGDLTLEKPFLQQRRYAQLGTRYTKPSVLGAPLRWGSGFHRVRGHNFHICPDLYLMHFGYSDMAIIRNRLNDSDRLSQGWERHLNKRTRLIRRVSAERPLDFDRWTHRARLCQTLVRPPYAWNKPALLGLFLVVELPQRFRNSL